MNIANRMKALKSSTIMDIAVQAQDLKQKGADVVSLAAGEPDFPTPKPICEAATRAMNDGMTRYAPSQGYTNLRERIAARVTEENGFKVSAEEVVITAGAKHALYLTMQCLINPGDTILVPTPAWVSYGPMLELCSANLMPLPTFEEDGYHLNIDKWKGLSIPVQTKGIILNSPNNPTGVVYSHAELKKLAGWALQRGLWILSDEIYEKILYDGNTHVSPASLGPEVSANTITVSGFSKSFCMTGWRLGWAIGNPELIQKMAALQSQSNSHVTSFVQAAGIAAIELDPKIITHMVNEFEKRRNYCAERLDRLSKSCSYTMPGGAFYFFVNFAKYLIEHRMSDVDFCRELLLKMHLGMVPGSAFGKTHCIRMSYATNLDQLKKAFDRLETYLSLKAR